MGSYQVKRKEQFGDVFKTNIFFRPTVVTVGESALKDVANQEARPSTMEAFFPPHHQKLFGPQSLLVQSGAAHSRLRRLIQPSLSPTSIASYQPTIDKAMDAFLDRLVAEKYQQPFELVPELRSFFIDIALNVLLGTTASIDDLSTDISIWSKGLLAAPLTFIPWSTAAKAMRARKRITAQLEPLVDSERSNPSSGLLGNLCSATDEDGATLSTEDIIDNVLTLIFAGSDTTASAATSLWMVLSQNPNLKSQVKANAGLAEGLVTQVLEAHPPAPFSMRLAKDEVHIGEFMIPAGWLVIYGFAGALHSMEEETSWKLDDDDAASASPASSVAFGGGPRMCPGRYLATLELTSLCRKLVELDWKLMPGQKLEQRYTPGFFPVDGLQIEFVSPP